MFRIPIACVLFVSTSTVIFAQQENNLFPDGPGQTLVDNTNAVIDGSQRVAETTIQQVNQAAQKTVGAAKSTAQGSADSMSRFVEPPQSNGSAMSTLSPANMIARWNESTKAFFDKTKKTLSPLSFEPPKMSLPRPKGRVRRFFGEFASGASTGGTRKRGFLPSIFPKREETPAKPKTVQDFLGLDRPE